MERRSGWLEYGVRSWDLTGCSEDLGLHGESHWRVWQGPRVIPQHPTPSPAGLRLSKMRWYFPDPLQLGVGRLLWGCKTWYPRPLSSDLNGKGVPASSFPPPCWLECGRDGRISRQGGSGPQAQETVHARLDDYGDGRNKQLLCLNPCHSGFQTSAVKPRLTNPEGLK